MINHDAFGFLWGDFGLPLAPFWVPLGSLWLPLGCPWTPFGPPWASLGCLGARSGSLWLPWGCLWAPLWLPWGRLGVPWRTAVPPELPGGVPGHPSACQGRSSTATAHKNKPARICPRIPGGPGEVAARSAVRSPTSTRAGGQDDVSLEQTPSNEYCQNARYFLCGGPGLISVGTNLV